MPSLLAAVALAFTLADCAGRGARPGPVSAPATVPVTNAARGAAATRGVATDAPDVDYARLEVNVLAEVNRARTDPKGYAAKLEALLPYYSGKVFRPPRPAPAMETVEGADAVREAIRALRAQTPLRALARSDGLTHAARDLVVDQGPTTRTGHEGTDGSRPPDRVARYGTWGVALSENIAYGPFTKAQDFVAGLIVDDGVRDRGHRRNLFDPNIKVAGVACGPHRKFGSMCVIVHAGSFVQAPARRAKPR
jgi:uncharacterized protein YkwD